MLKAQISKSAAQTRYLHTGYKDDIPPPYRLFHWLSVHPHETDILRVSERRDLRLDSQIEMEFFVELGKVQHAERLRTLPVLRSTLSLVRASLSSRFGVKQARTRAGWGLW